MRKITTFHKFIATGLALGLVAGAAVPGIALAKKHRHQTACEAHKAKEKDKGLVVGAIVGGVAGNLIGGKKHRLVGTAGGAAVGAYAGQKLAKDKVKCND